ncbi:MAG: SAP domain-containing protein [Candidatus Thalassarchaeaceae archaeon]|nr:SAP domain-containing protein [Candidatus Thalassarchaeaceae archaeon]
MSEEDFSKLTVAELKIRLKEMGLPLTGKKADLINRIEEAQDLENLDEVLLIDDDGDALLIEDVVDDVDEDLSTQDTLFEAEIIDDIDEEYDEIFGDDVFEAEISPQPSRSERASRTMGSTSPWYKDGTNIATILVVLLLAAGGGWWYHSQQEVDYQVAPPRYGDNLQFSVSNGLLLADGDEMVDYLRQSVGESLDQVCGELRIDFTGSGSASITEGTLTDLKDSGDDHLRGAVMMNGPYGRWWNSVESDVQYHLDADLSGYTWSAIDSDSCSQNTDWSRNNNQLDVGVKQWTELTERTLLRTDSNLDLTDSDGQRSALSVTTFGAVSGSDAITDLIDVALMPMHPVNLYDVFQLRELEVGVSDNYDGWDWVVGDTTTIAGQDAIMVYMDHVETRQCLGRATMTLWVIPNQPLPGKQSVDIMLDGQGDGTCSTGMKLAIEYAFPDGTFTSRYTIQQTSFIRGSNLLDWNEAYSSRPMAGQGIPDDDERMSWNAGTHMWDDPDNSSTSSRTYTLEKAVECVVTDFDAFGSANVALSGNGYVFAAQDDRTGMNPVWNLSWISSDDAGWVRVTWPGGENCLNTGDGPLTGDDKPDYGRDRIPETLELSDLESLMTSSALYPNLHSQIMMGGSLRDDAQLGYNLVIPEDNPVTDLLPDDYLNGKVTVHIERTWTSGGEDHVLQAGMDGETGRMAGWYMTSTVAD